MFEKISGFFKQFGRGRKRQSGETTIMESNESGADDFGLDDEFADTDDFGVGGSFGDSGDLGDSGGFGDTDGEEPDITTGGTDFDERTVSDEISGASEGGLGKTDADFAGAFDAGEQPDEGFADADIAEPERTSPVKAVLVIVVAVAVAIGAGAAFQAFAWPSVSKMVGLAKTDGPTLDPQAVLNAEARKKTSLTGELAEFKAVGGPAQVQELKKEIASIRDTQGPLEEFVGKSEALKKSEETYDALLTKINKIEGDVGSTRKDIGSIKVDIEQAGRRVVELAKQTEQEYERFHFEMVRAELGRRTLIELKLEDIESFKAEIAELQERLSNLAMAVPAETSDNY